MRTFVVRMMGEGSPGDPLRGSVEVVATGDIAHFSSAEQLVAFLSEAVERARAEAAATSAIER